MLGNGFRGSLLDQGIGRPFAPEQAVKPELASAISGGLVSRARLQNLCARVNSTRPASLNARLHAPCT